MYKFVYRILTKYENIGTYLIINNVSFNYSDDDI